MAHTSTTVRKPARRTWIPLAVVLASAAGATLGGVAAVTPSGVPLLAFDAGETGSPALIVGVFAAEDCVTLYPWQVPPGLAVDPRCLP